MGLRARLALFFVAITVVPMTVTLVVLQTQIDRQLRQQAVEELQAASRSASALLRLTQQRAGDVADQLVELDVAAVLADASPAQAAEWLSARFPAGPGGRADFILLLSADGAPLVERRAQPMYAAGFEAPSAEVLAEEARSERVPTGVLLEARQVQGNVEGEPARVLGWVVAGVWLDGGLLDMLPVGDGLALVDDGEVLAVEGASAGELPAELPPVGRVQEAQLGGAHVLLAAVPVEDGDDQVGDLLLVSWTRVGGRVTSWIPVLLLPAVLVAATLGWLIASTVVAPVRRAADAARALATGDLDHRLEPTGGPELADLAAALNVMSEELSSRLAQLERSSVELRGSLARLGETLSSSLDLNRTLAVVTETAMDTLGADRAALQLFTPERDALYTKVGRGLGEAPARLRVGEGVTGWVAETAIAVRLPADARQVPPAAPGEPIGAQHLAVPMMGRGHVLGVLSLIRDEPRPEYTQDDLDTIRSFAAQASVAIENVMLHQEAQRLSVTDLLTGLWNFRYFQLQADRELESATRFDRAMSLLIIDIDHFKPVNDRYGHQVGDDALTEVARRIRDSTRIPDVVARYGGEEFVVLLPGTALEGGMATGERIRAAVAGTPIVVVDGQPLTVTCSVGVAALPAHGQTISELLRSADAAMYTAKTWGRNQVVDADSAAGAGVDRRRGVPGGTDGPGSA